MTSSTEAEADAGPGSGSGSESKASPPPADDGEGGGGGVEAAAAAAPQSREEEGGADDADADAAAAAAARFGSTSSVTSAAGGTDGEEMLYDLKLSPMDYHNHRQNLKDVEWAVPPAGPPLEEEEEEVGEEQVASAAPPGARCSSEEEEESALHRDEYSISDDPLNHESALESALASGPSSSSRFRRSVRRLAPPPAVSGGSSDRQRPPGGRHSHPRKSPYRSEVARLRHAQKQQQQQQQQQAETTTATTATGAAPGAAGGGSTAGSSGKSRSVGIKDTTAPPDTAHFSIQSARLKHAILDSLGDFLTGAFADDEETGGSYYSQDLLDQLSASNPYLRGVWLQAKNLNDDHVRGLCDALIRNKVVTEVWLPSNRITDVGAGHIAHMLKFNRYIKELFLGENDIGPRGAAALAAALAGGNHTLVALGLGDNRIGVEGAGAFAAALRHNHTLHTLDVKNNGIPRRSSIRGLLNKMLEFNSSDPGDENLVLGLQEELVKLVTGLPPDVAEGIVSQAEDALKLAMLCRRRGDRVGAAEAEGMFIRICTTGVVPADPPTAGEAEAATGGFRGTMLKVKKRSIDPDGADGRRSADASTAKVADANDDEDDAGPTVEDVGDVGGVGEGERPSGSDDEVKIAEESPSEEDGLNGTKDVKASAGD
jgi:hypothetical protein